MGQVSGEMLTEDRVNLLIAEAIQDLRAEQGELHRQNLTKMDLMVGALNQLKGAVWMVSTIVATAGVVGVVLEIARYLKVSP
jgi:hypothetical protein